MPFSWTTGEVPTANKMNQMAIAGPCARVYHNAAQSVTNNALTALAFNSERFDTDAIHDTVTNNSRLTATTAGKYQITGSAQFAGNANGVRIVQIRKGGATVLASQTTINIGANAMDLTITTLEDMAAGDYVELVIYQDSGGALNINSIGNRSPEFMMVRVA
jgi:hypothetical protein